MLVLRLSSSLASLPASRPVDSRLSRGHDSEGAEEGPRLRGEGLRAEAGQKVTRELPG